MANDFQIANEHLMPVVSQAELPCTNDVWFKRKLKVAKISEQKFPKGLHTESAASKRYT